MPSVDVYENFLERSHTVAGGRTRSQAVAGGGHPQSFLSKDHRTLDSMGCTVWCIVRAVGWFRLGCITSGGRRGGHWFGCSGFLDDIKVESRMATAADGEQEKVRKMALRLEQTTAGAWVKRQGWYCIADYLEGDILLQVLVQVGGVTMT